MNEQESAAQAQTAQVFMLAVLKKLADIETKLKGMDKPMAQLSLGQAKKEYEDFLWARTKKPENYVYLLRRLVDHFGIERNLAEITAEEIEGFLNKNWKDSTLKQRLIQLKGFFNFCVLSQRKRNLPVFPNPCDLIRIKAMPIEKPEMIEVDRIGRLLRTLSSEEEQLIFLIPLTAGLRVSEILKLTPADVCLSRRRKEVRKDE